MDIVLLVRIGIIVDGVVVVAKQNYELCGRRVDDGTMTALSRHELKLRHE